MDTIFIYRQKTDATIWISIIFFMLSIFFVYHLFDPNFETSFKGIKFDHTTSWYLYLFFFMFTFGIALLGIASILFEKNNKNALMRIDTLGIRVPRTLFTKEKYVTYNQIKSIKLKEQKPHRFLILKIHNGSITLISSYFETPEKFEQIKDIIIYRANKEKS